MEIFHKEAKTGPKDLFLYITMMAALYVSAGSLIKLLFDIINILYPDRLYDFSYDPYSGALRFAMASLIIVFPIYLIVTRYLTRDLAAHPEKKDLGIRRWLIYLTLFTAAAIIAGDLIALINTFLNGELTIRFVLKIITVLVVAGGIFGGYGYVIKTAEPKKKIINIFIIVSAIVVLVSIVAGFLAAGSPVKARKIRFDSQRIGDLQNIQWQVVNSWQNKRQLPEDLAALADSLSGFIAPADPVTGEGYDYHIVGPLTFELCADFALPSQEAGRYGTPPRVALIPIEKTGPLGVGMDNWRHDGGETCFERTIDPDFYTPRD